MGSPNRCFIFSFTIKLNYFFNRYFSPSIPPSFKNFIFKIDGRKEEKKRVFKEKESATRKISKHTL